MPEGDTVCRAARQLDRALTGQRADRAPTSGCPRSPPSTSPGAHGHRDRLPRQAPAHPHRRTSARGPSTPTSRWRARWRVYRAGRALAPAGHTARVVLRHRRTRRPSASRSASSRWCPRDAEADLVGHLGPDLLGPDWDADEAAAPTSRATPTRPIERGPARPAQPGRHRQHVRGRALLHHAASHPAAPVGRRARPAPARAPGPADARGQQGAGDPVDDRRPAASASGSGSTAATAAVPPLRHADRGRRCSASAAASAPAYWCPSCQPER